MKKVSAGEIQMVRDQLQSTMEKMVRVSSYDFNYTRDFDIELQYTESIVPMTAYEQLWKILAAFDLIPDDLDALEECVPEQLQEIVRPFIKERKENG